MNKLYMSVGSIYTTFASKSSIAAKVAEISLLHVSYRPYLKHEEF